MKYTSNIFPSATQQYQLYFDGRCPLCSKEMALLKRLKRSQLSLVDIHGINELADDAKEDLLRILHLQKPDGTWLKGIDANVTAWSFTPIGILWKPLGWKIWRNKMNALYLRWADKRYCKNYACDFSNNPSHTRTNIAP